MGQGRRREVNGRTAGKSICLNAGLEHPEQRHHGTALALRPRVRLRARRRASRRALSNADARFLGRCHSAHSLDSRHSPHPGDALPARLRGLAGLMPSVNINLTTVTYNAQVPRARVESASRSNPDGPTGSAPPLGQMVVPSLRIPGKRRHANSSLNNGPAIYLHEFIAMILFWSRIRQMPCCVC